MKNDRYLSRYYNNLEDYLIYGSYPEVVSATTQIEKRACLTEITHSY